MTRSEAASALRLTQPTVSRYLARRWLQAVRIGNRLWIRRDSVARLLAYGTPSSVTN